MRRSTGASLWGAGEGPSKGMGIQRLFWAVGHPSSRSWQTRHRAKSFHDSCRHRAVHHGHHHVVRSVCRCYCAVITLVVGDGQNDCGLHHRGSVACIGAASSIPLGTGSRLCAHFPTSSRALPSACAPRRPLTMSGGIFGCHSWVGGYRYYCGESGDAARHPSTHRTAPTRSYLVQRVSSVWASGVVRGQHEGHWEGWGPGGQNPPWERACGVVTVKARLQTRRLGSGLALPCSCCDDGSFQVSPRRGVSVGCVQRRLHLSRKAEDRPRQHSGHVSSAEGPDGARGRGQARPLSPLLPLGHPSLLPWELGGPASQGFGLSLALPTGFLGLQLAGRGTCQPPQPSEPIPHHMQHI